MQSIPLKITFCNVVPHEPSSYLLFGFFRQYQDFLEDLEEDEALRKNVNIYRGEQLHTLHGTSVLRPALSVQRTP